MFSYKLYFENKIIGALITPYRLNIDDPLILSPPIKKPGCYQIVEQKKQPDDKIALHLERKKDEQKTERSEV